MLERSWPELEELGKNAISVMFLDVLLHLGQTDLSFIYFFQISNATKT